MGRDQSRSRSRSRSRSNSSDVDEDGYRVHVSDLGMHPDKREIERTFEKFGPIIEIWLARNPPCFAFIKFRHQEDGEEAIRELDGSELCGNRIRVSQARPRTRGRRPRGYDPSLRCYSCGETGHFSRDCNFHNRRFRSRSRERGRNTRRSRSRSGGRNPRRNQRRSNSRDQRSRSPKRRMSENREANQQTGRTSVSPF